MKRNILITLLGFSMLWFLSGCEGKFEDRAGVPMSMQLNTEYLVLPGDEVVPSGDTVIVVRHVLSSGNKYVTIKSGNARLLRGDYVLKK